VLTLQLGAGASIAAIEDGKVRETSMGFSPNEGLVMATRSGDVDPSLVTFLQRAEGLGGGRDMRALLDADDEDARLAVEVYCHRARHYLGAYLVLLGGADGILFGGGVGESAPEIRRRILSSLEWCGIALDDEGQSVGRVEVHVVAVDEAREMAADAETVL